jgi:MraZ protein
LIGFCGTFTCTVDDKGRLSIPARIRPGHGESSKRRGIGTGVEMVLTEGLDGCLTLYTEEGWSNYKKLISSKPATKKKIRYFNRRLYQNTSLVRVDKSGRINIPEKLVELAGLGKEVLVIGVENTIEIWNPAKYDEYLDEFGQTYEDVAEDVTEELRRDEPDR